MEELRLDTLEGVLESICGVDSPAEYVDGLATVGPEVSNDGDAKCETVDVATVLGRRSDVLMDVSGAWVTSIETSDGDARSIEES